MYMYHSFLGDIRPYVFHIFQIFQTTDLQQERQVHIKRACET